MNPHDPPENARTARTRSGSATDELTSRISHPGAPRASRLTAEAFRLAPVGLTPDEFAEWLGRRFHREGRAA
jgi:hypothetical protein